MCGIFGVLNFEHNQLELARSSLHTITHRGPDQWGEYVAPPIYLGHRRLSIRDLSENGRQPFVDATTGVAVIVNGEIWNDKQLRNELGEHRFRGHSDCEVFLHGYLHWGLEGLLQRLDGFFAAAIYDPRSQNLHLIKDRFGKKPLYYAQNGKEWIFASEAKAILAYAPACRTFDLAGLQHWMCFRGSLQTSTIFKGIQKVLPATYLTLDTSGKQTEKQYYDLIDFVALHYPEKTEDDTALDSKVETLLSQAIEKRFISDVPVGLQLSGGVDSSLIALLAKEIHGERLDTFTVTFSHVNDQDFDESDYARAVAQHCGYRHHEIPVDNKIITDAFPHVVWLFDGMLDIPNAIPIHLLSKQAKSHVSVMLTGEGADELFGGYSKFSWAPALASQASSWKKNIPDFLFDKLPLPMGVQHRLHNTFVQKKYAGQPDNLLRNLNCFISPESLERLWGVNSLDPLSSINSKALSKLPIAKQFQLVDQLTYLNFLLERQDKASMGAAMEARLPFLDQSLIEAIAPISANQLFDGQHLKKNLKRLLAKRMGDDFTYRKKVGFALPIAHWLQDNNGLGAYVEKALSPDFILWRKVDRQPILDYLNTNSFTLRQISYADDERHWLKWFLAVLAAAQEAFQINEIN